MSVRRRLLPVLAIAVPLFAGIALAGPDPRGPLALPTSLQDAEREVAEADRRLTEIDLRSARIASEVSILERRSTARARAYVRLARAGLLPVAGGLDALLQHAMKIEAARRAIATDMGALKTMQKERLELSQSRELLSSRRALVSAQRDAFAQAQSIMDEAEDRKRAFERAFATSAAAESGHVAVYGAGITVHEDEPAGSSGFAALKGRLTLPVPGRTEIRAARRESASGPGLELRAVKGAAVRSVYSGRVAFSSKYGDYGRIVIVDHGDRYFTVYGNLGTVDLKVGDELTTGGRIGTVGDDSGAPMLYFEVRHGSETMDPRPWLGLLASSATLRSPVTRTRSP
jgi:murein hydrolase activator